MDEFKEEQLPQKNLEQMDGQVCPMCSKSTLTLSQYETEVPYFGNVFIFSMSCSTCNYRKADVEPEKTGEPCKYTLDVEREDDMKIRIVKSSTATVKIPHMMNIEPGPSAEGYVTNVEGLLHRVKSVLEMEKEAEEDDDVRKRVKNMLQKLQRVMWGQEKLRIIIEDPDGNSAIISDKAVKGKLSKT
ncbi:ZPR1 zinc finger domain-containing protein [Candidatus Woesearchaeota archaeon]|nr:ZPR1 zinc finger domain-containing protein [Candidatus Woesearchaeota archaeon]